MALEFIILDRKLKDQGEVVKWDPSHHNLVCLPNTGVASPSHIPSMFYSKCT